MTKVDVCDFVLKLIALLLSLPYETFDDELTHSPKLKKEKRHKL